jgi:hypothetical protein
MFCSQILTLKRIFWFPIKAENLNQRLNRGNKMYFYFKEWYIYVDSVVKSYDTE